MSESESNPLPDYASVVAALQRCAVHQEPAELHGFALGMYVAGVQAPRDVWQREVYAEFDPASVLDNECRQILDRVYSAVFDNAAGEPLALSLLLPEDIVVNAARLFAVRDWCQGFLFGFGLSGDATGDRLSAQAHELLGDFAEIARLDTDDDENSADNQSALIEIEEYLREGAMLIRDELSAARLEPGDQSVN